MLNRCVHVGHSLYLVTYIGDLRYKMLLICAIHQKINNLDISKVYACVFQPVKSPIMRTLYERISLKLMLTFINLR